jgi:peptide/nickel transport system substrate-binding protein
MTRQSSRRNVCSVIGVVVLATGILVGASSSGAATHPRASTTLNVAFEPDAQPTSVFPFDTAAQCTTDNIDYWNLMYRPGYWFGLGASVTEQPALSSFNSPTITTSDGKTTASFTIKPWVWSDGNGPDASTETLDAQTVAFWLNMDKAESATSGGAADEACDYTPGMGLPDQVANITYSGSAIPGTGNEVSIMFTTTLNPRFLLYNELSQIQPMPVAWDTTTSGGAPGSGGCSSEAFASVTDHGSDACATVFKYLNNLPGSDALWDWSDGPYRQQVFGYAPGLPGVRNFIQVANTNYSGSPKPSGALTIDYFPYTSVTPEVHDLQNGTLDLGYLGSNNVSRSPGAGKAGHILLPRLTKYKAVGSVLWGIYYWSINFGTKYSTSPETGASPPVWVDELNQTYIRGAIQQSINQADVIARVDDGYATPTISAIPMFPTNPYMSGLKNPYPFSVKEAKRRLTAHHWKIVHGVQTCQVTNCGTTQYPIAMGSKLRFTLIFPTGVPSSTLQVTEEQATMKRAGVVITPRWALDTVQQSCGVRGWELCGYGGWIYTPDYYPEGSQLFLTGAASNVGGYSDPIMDALIHATDFGDLTLSQVDPASHTSYAQYSATSVPVIWQPTPTSFEVEARSVVGSQPPSPLEDFNPEFITAI